MASAFCSRSRGAHAGLVLPVHAFIRGDWPAQFFPVYSYLGERLRAFDIPAGIPTSSPERPLPAIPSLAGCICLPWHLCALAGRAATAAYIGLHIAFAALALYSSRVCLALVSWVASSGRLVRVRLGRSGQHEHDHLLSGRHLARCRSGRGRARCPRRLLGRPSLELAAGRVRDQPDPGDLARPGRLLRPARHRWLDRLSHLAITGSTFPAQRPPALLSPDELGGLRLRLRVVGAWDAPAACHGGTVESRRWGLQRCICLGGGADRFLTGRIPPRGAWWIFRNVVVVHRCGCTGACFHGAGDCPALAPDAVLRLRWGMQFHPFPCRPNSTTRCPLCHPATFRRIACALTGARGHRVYPRHCTPGCSYSLLSPAMGPFVCGVGGDSACTGSTHSCPLSLTGRKWSAPFARSDDSNRRVERAGCVYRAYQTCAHSIGCADRTGLSDALGSGRPHRLSRVRGGS